MPTAEIGRRRAWPLLAVVLLAGLGLRLWGIEQGLPYAYNTDEADHFVPRAVAMFAHGLNPHYFANPPAFTYLLHFLFALAYGGGSAAQSTFALHPTEVYTLARASAAVLGVAALWLLYATGARLFGRGVGLLAAAIEAVAFLPVFYSHLALNDVPTIAPLTLSLLGTAGVLRRGRRVDYLLAGVGLGLACASKYTAGIAAVPLAAAVAVRYLDGGPGAARRALSGIALAGGLALAVFVIANPYALLDFHTFHGELVHQSTLSAEAQGKLGAPRHGGLAYYLWALTWGLGWVPTLAALAGAVSVWWAGPAGAGRRAGWLLVPAPLLYLAFMGAQGRYFGRWLLPIFPFLCLLAAVFAWQAAAALSARASRLRARAERAGGLTPLPAEGAARPVVGARLSGVGAPSLAAEAPGSLGGAALGGGAAPPPQPPPPAAGGRLAHGRTRALHAGLLALFTVLLLAQGLLYSIHSGLVLARADTRNLTRAWLVAHVPAGAPIVVEPVSPDEWARERKPGTSTAANPYRWAKYPSLLSRISSSGALRSGPPARVGIEDYERTLSPALIAYYERHGYCWVVSGSTQSGRAFADPGAAPEAVAYYRALAEQGEVVYRSSPYARGQGPVPFGFDWSFDYYPLAYDRPGPVMTVYRLHAGKCAV